VVHPPWRNDVVTAQDIDKLLAEITANQKEIKSLTRAKNTLLQDLQNELRCKAKRAEPLVPGQMCAYREFSHMYEIKSALLARTYGDLKKKMNQNHLPHEILKPYTNLVVVHSGLAAITARQKYIIATLQTMATEAEQTLSALRLS